MLALAGPCQACDGSAALIPDRGPLMLSSPYLGGGDVFPPFDVQQAQDVVGVCVDVVKTRGRPALLVAGDRTEKPKFKCSKSAACLLRGVWRRQKVLNYKRMTLI